ncbi:MAG: hypothetical protein PUB00_02395 [Clostridiales bacterium]|nr:hypothetical protein [Clostridiales bacterium]
MKKTFKWKKSFVLLVSAAVLVFGVVGGTLAWLIAEPQQVTNNFEYAQVSCQVEETFKDNVKSNVSIKNTSNVSAYIRAAVVVTWQDAAGNVYGTNPVADRDYTIAFNTNGWTKRGGFYYWDQPVEKDGYTGELITTCEPIGGKAPEGYTLCVEIVAEAVQAEPATVVSEAWGFAPVSSEN